MSGTTISITINGEARQLAAGTSLTDLCASLEIDPAKIAIEHNREIAPRGQYGAIILSDGDELEIVHFVGGG
ncbi:sulfur carrier protein ThiS [Alterisphingorhabdus coralli]|uniref:sulfur carrier protein ThiS n=1 Tax=Alterisphingorhabdus coralli TaxID=3071408 RepID=UPI003873299C